MLEGMRGSRRAPPAPQESGTRLARSARRTLVLVVDDNEDNRDIYASFLGYHGFDVEQASDGAEALDRIDRRIPDLVLMDLSMPVLDGWEATRRIKADERTKRVVVVVVTGNVLGESLRRAEAAGADAVLTKPCRPHEILGVVRRLLARARTAGGATRPLARASNVR
jgi:CheY-like chemotaxis protein